MLKGMTWEHFLEWGAYADLEPFDESRADLRNAHIVKTLIDSNRKKGSPRVKLEDCLLPFGKRADQRPRTKQEAEENRMKIMATMRILAEIYNAPKPKARVRRGD